MIQDASGRIQDSEGGQMRIVRRLRPLPQIQDRKGNARLPSPRLALRVPIFNRANRYR